MLGISHLVAFGAGILSFLSPCVLPMVPVYLATLAGATAMDENFRKGYQPAFWHSLSFTAGFSIIFIMLGISAGLFGGMLSIPVSLLNKIAGSLIIAFGIFMLAAFRVRWLNYEKRLLLPFYGNNPSYIRSLLIGAVFSLGWTPCVSPILGTILTLAANSQTVWQGASLLTVYSLGLGIPFILAGLAFGSVIPLWKGLKRHSGIIALISGLLLIALGILMITDSLTWINSFFSS